MAKHKKSKSTRWYYTSIAFLLFILGGVVMLALVRCNMPKMDTSEPTKTTETTKKEKSSKKSTVDEKDESIENVEELTPDHEDHPLFEELIGKQFKPIEWARGSSRHLTFGKQGAVTVTYDNVIKDSQNQVEKIIKITGRGRVEVIEKLDDLTYLLHWKAYEEESNDDEFAGVPGLNDYETRIGEAPAPFVVRLPRTPIEDFSPRVIDQETANSIFDEDVYDRSAQTINIFTLEFYGVKDATPGTTPASGWFEVIR